MSSTNLINFNDILKSSFLEKASNFSILDTAIGLGLAFAIGVFIYIVYKKTFKGVMYSEGFGVSLLAMTMITTLIIMAITTNVVLSLGMVGALSIVRFRSAIKEPMDIAFIFWAICSGIVIGAGIIPLAVIGTVIIGIIMLVFSNKKSIDNPYILVINCENNHVELQAMEMVKKEIKNQAMKSKTISAGNGIELTIEVKLKNSATDFVNKLSDISGVNNVVLVSYNGEYMS